MRCDSARVSRRLRRAQDFAKRAAAACGKDVPELTRAFASLPPAQAPFFCLDLSFCHTVLTQGFDLMEDAAITLVKQVRGRDVTVCCAGVAAAVWCADGAALAAPGALHVIAVNASGLALLPRCVLLRCRRSSTTGRSLRRPGRWGRRSMSCRQRRDDGASCRDSSLRVLGRDCERASVAFSWIIRAPHWCQAAASDCDALRTRDAGASSSSSRAHVVHGALYTQPSAMRRQ